MGIATSFGSRIGFDEEIGRYVSLRSFQLQRTSLSIVPLDNSTYTNLLL